MKIVIKVNNNDDLRENQASYINITIPQTISPIPAFKRPPSKCTNNIGNIFFVSIFSWLVLTRTPGEKGLNRLR